MWKPTRDQRFASLSLAARAVFAVIRESVDGEGRMRADPYSLQFDGAMARIDQREIANLVASLAETGLIELYDGGRHLFFPMFPLDEMMNWGSHRKYYAKSKCPLPPRGLLEKHTEYFDFLKRINKRSQLHYNGEEDIRNDRHKGARYPELWEKQETEPVPDILGGRPPKVSPEIVWAVDLTTPTLPSLQSLPSFNPRRRSSRTTTKAQTKTQRSPPPENDNGGEKIYGLPEKEFFELRKEFMQLTQGSDQLSYDAAIEKMKIPRKMVAAFLDFGNEKRLKGEA